MFLIIVYPDRKVLYIYASKINGNYMFSFRGLCPHPTSGISLGNLIIPEKSGYPIITDGIRYEITGR